jgi:cell division protein FtsB
MMSDTEQTLEELRAENATLRTRITTLELELASWRGTLSFPSKEQRDEFRLSYVIEPPKEEKADGQA